MNEAPVKVVWEPLPGSSQELSLSCPCDELLFTGTRGSGKTEGQLMDFRQYVGLGYGAFWRGVIFDRAYKNLDDILAKSRKLYNAFEDGAKFNNSTSSYKWVWPTGEELLFRVLSKDSDYWDYHGQEFPYIGFNELTKFPTKVIYDLMKSCNRTSYVSDGTLPELPLKIFSTCNPYGLGKSWIKKYFVLGAPYGKIQEDTVECFNPRTSLIEKITRRKVCLFGSYKENKYLNKQYVAGLNSIEDENLKSAWVDGSWDSVSGDAFGDIFAKDLHILPRFRVPGGWWVDRAFDWGSSHPYYVGWFAEANGEDAILNDGTIICPPRGTLFLIHELYGTTEIGSNIGVKHSPEEICNLIKKEEIGLMREGWIKKQPSSGPADNQIGNEIVTGQDSIRAQMQDCGIIWTTSDKSAGSRKHGLVLTRARLSNCINSERPGLYFMGHCQAAIQTIPELPRDPNDLDDVDTMAEDHPYDTLRYKILSLKNGDVIDPSMVNLNYGGC